MNLTRKGGLAAIVVAALVAVGVVSTAPALAASATNTPPAGQCVVDTIHHDAQYKYSQVIPGQTETYHTEYRFRTRVPLYGEMEVKDIEGYDFGGSGQTTVNGHVIPGQFFPSAGTHTIPAAVVNAVWGPGGIPDYVLGTGQVWLDTYGGPHVRVNYNAHKIQTTEGYTPWSDWSDWSTTNPGAASDTKEVQVDDAVSNNDGVPAKTVYYLPGGGQSDTNTDANWTTETPGAPWTKIAGEEKAAYDEDVYGPCPTYGQCAANVGPINVYESTAASHGFGTTFTRDGGTVTWVANGVQLDTPLSNDKATFGLTSGDFNIPLSDLTALSFTITHLQDGSIPSQRMSFNVPFDYNGPAAGGFTTIVVEMVYNGMSLDAFQGGNAIVWSSNAIPGFPNRDTFKSWNDLLQANPNGVLLGQILVNQGGGNAGLKDVVNTLTVGNKTACTTYAFATDPLTEFEPASPTKVDVCGVENDSFTLPGAQPNELESITPEGTYTADDLPDVDGTVAVTLVPADDYAVKDDPNADYEVDKDGNAVWILVFTDEACPIVITPGGPTKTDVCGVANDTFTLLGATPGVRESVTSEGKYTATGDPAKGENVVVTFVPNSDHTVKPSVDGSYEVVGGNAVWTLKYTNESCPTPPGGLATTGSNPWPLIALIVALLAAGVYMTREGYWRRKTLQS